MDNYLISQPTSLVLVVCTCLLFAFFGIFYSRKFQDLSNYLTANRSVRLFSLTTSLTASALGAWILWLGWFGFNGGSELVVSSEASAVAVSQVFLNTNMAAAGGVVGALILSLIMTGKMDVTM